MAWSLTPPEWDSAIVGLGKRAEPDALTISKSEPFHNGYPRPAAQPTTGGIQPDFQW